MTAAAVAACGCEGGTLSETVVGPGDSGSTPPLPKECSFTANDRKVGIGRTACGTDRTAEGKYLLGEQTYRHGAPCHFCYAEFTTPPEGCFAYPEAAGVPGATAYGLCVPDCAACAPTED
jgi:hypothetical protein